MIIEILLIAVVIAWFIAASIFDIKTREVPNWLSYSLIIISLTFKLLISIKESNFSYIGYSLLGFIIFFGLANLMYYTKQWGGGDSKLLIAVGVIFASYPSSLLKYFNPNLNAPFLLIVLLNILISGAVYGLILSFLLSLKNRNKFSKEFKTFIKKNEFKKTRNITLILVIILIILSFFLIKNTNIKYLLIGLLIFPIIFIYAFSFLKSVEKSTMYKLIKIEKLTEGDWIVNSIKDNNKIIYNSKSPGVTKEQIKKLVSLKKKLRIEQVLVKEGLPFVPAFLIGIILSLIFGNIIIWFI
jgi:preflagellin peptidase FlaK